MTSTRIISNAVMFSQIEDIIAQGESAQLLVKGYSMRPFIRNGRDSVKLAPCVAEELQVGDVILFRYKGQHVMHRIVSRGDNDFVMAGDGNYKLEERCTSTDIVAKVEGIIKHNGTYLLTSSKRWRLRSKLWLTTPALLRKCILGFLYRIGYR